MIHHYDHFRDVPLGLWPWENFTAEEMADSKTGALVFSISFMDRLQALRTALEFPLIVNSGFRTTAHDKAIGGAGVHTTGRAVDIGIYGARYHAMLDLAPAMGFNGIGSFQKGPYAGRFIHLDDLNNNETTGPRPWGWSY